MIRLLNNSVKWIGGGLGWVFGGPLGGVLGFVAGTAIESFSLRNIDKKTASDDFATNLLMLFASVMKADGPVVKPELDYVKRFLKQNFGKSKALEALGQLKDILKQNIPLTDVCIRIRNNLDLLSRTQLAGFLYNLAKVDGSLTETEKTILNIINQSLGVSVNDNELNGAAFIQDDPVIVAAYKTLGVNQSADIGRIKKAYRNLANKYHPDKVAFLDENQKKTAKDKFQKLTNAYETVKKERNFS